MQTYSANFFVSLLFDFVAELLFVIFISWFKVVSEIWLKLVVWFQVIRFNTWRDFLSSYFPFNCSRISNNKSKGMQLQILTICFIKLSDKLLYRKLFSANFAQRLCRQFHSFSIIYHNSFIMRVSCNFMEITSFRVHFEVSQKKKENLLTHTCMQLIFVNRLRSLERDFNSSMRCITMAID